MCTNPGNKSLECSVLWHSDPTDVSPAKGTWIWLFWCVGFCTSSALSPVSVKERRSPRNLRNFTLQEKRHQKMLHSQCGESLDEEIISLNFIFILFCFFFFFFFLFWPWFFFSSLDRWVRRMERKMMGLFLKATKVIAGLFLPCAICGVWQCSDFWEMCTPLPMCPGNIWDCNSNHVWIITSRDITYLGTPDKCWTASKFIWAEFLRSWRKHIQENQTHGRLPTHQQSLLAKVLESVLGEHRNIPDW